MTKLKFHTDLAEAPERLIEGTLVRKHVEKLRYMHRNPVKRGLVERLEPWKWSSFRAYRYGETGPVRLKFQEWALGIKRRPVESFAEVENPVICKVRK